MRSDGDVNGGETIAADWFDGDSDDHSHLIITDCLNKVVYKQLQKARLHPLFKTGSFYPFLDQADLLYSGMTDGGRGASRVGEGVEAWRYIRKYNDRILSWMDLIVQPLK